MVDIDTDDNRFSLYMSQIINEILFKYDHGPYC